MKAWYVSYVMFLYVIFNHRAWHQSIYWVSVSATVLAETRARDSAPGSATAECVSSVSATVSATAETNKIGFGRSLPTTRVACFFDSQCIIPTYQVNIERNVEMLIFGCTYIADHSDSSISWLPIYIRGLQRRVRWSDQVYTDTVCLFVCLSVCLSWQELIIESWRQSS